MIRKKYKQMKIELYYFMFLIPALIGFSVFFILPLISNVYYSLTNWNGLNTQYDFVGLRNYTFIIKDKELVQSIRNTLLYAGVLTIMQNALAIPLAVGLDSNIKAKNFYRLIFFIPAVMSPLVVGFLWSYIMSPQTGLMWVVSEALGIPTVNWLGNPKLVMYSLIIVSVWQWTGWGAVIYLANLQNISHEYYNAAKVDGANGWHQFWNITFPMLAPSMTINVINSMIGSLKVFDIVMAMTQGGPGSASETITTVLIKRAFTEGMLGYGSSIAIVFIVIVAVISVLLYQILNRREDRLL